MTGLPIDVTNRKRSKHNADRSDKSTNRNSNWNWAQSQTLTQDWVNFIQFKLSTFRERDEGICFAISFSAASWRTKRNLWLVSLSAPSTRNSDAPGRRAEHSQCEFHVCALEKLRYKHAQGAAGTRKIASRSPCTHIDDCPKAGDAGTIRHRVR